MKTKEEIEENLSKIVTESNTPLSEYMKGYATALEWVLELL